MVARYYDLEHDALVADAALYCELARRSGGPVLELGCGTGRVLAALLRAGYGVVGVDCSRPMLARAAARLSAAQRAGARPEVSRRGRRSRRPQPHRGEDRHAAERSSGTPAAPWRLVAADLRELTLDERFPLVLAPLDLLGHFLTLDDQLAALAAARSHLAPSGQLVIDVAFPDGAFVGQPEGVLVHQWTHHARNGEVVTKWWVREIAAASQLQRLTAFYDVVAPDGALRRWVHELALRYYYRYELELLLARAGFTVEAVYGDYTFEELRADSSRLLVVARPAAARAKQSRRARLE